MIGLGKVMMVLLIVLAGCVVPTATPPVSPVATPTAGVGVGTPVGGSEMAGVWEVMDLFFQDTRLYVILGLVGLDLVLGVAMAIKAGVFEWAKVGQFYQTNVVPYVLGYLALYVAFKVPDVEGLVGEGLVMVAFGVVVANLVASIGAHLAGLEVVKALRGQ